jgi:lambda family phage tail tape measure protein
MQASGSGGGLLGSAVSFLTGGSGGGGAADVFPGSGSVTPGYTPWADGGYTGPGGKYQPTGIVHKGEYVFDQDAVKRIGVGNLAMLQRGYANGGLVGAPSISMPRIPTIQGGSNSGGGYNDNRQITIDARGAQQGVGSEIAAALKAYDRQSLPRTLAALRAAKNRGMV